MEIKIDAAYEIKNTTAYINTKKTGWNNFCLSFAWWLPAFDFSPTLSINEYKKHVPHLFEELKKNGLLQSAYRYWKYSRIRKGYGYAGQLYNMLKNEPIFAEALRCTKPEKIGESKQVMDQDGNAHDVMCLTVERIDAIYLRQAYVVPIWKASLKDLDYPVVDDDLRTIRNDDLYFCKLWTPYMPKSVGWTLLLGRDIKLGKNITRIL